MNYIDLEQRLGITDPNFEQTRLFLKTATSLRGGRRFNILASSRDNGETNVILPVLDQLSERSFDVFVMAIEQGGLLYGSRPDFLSFPHQNPMSFIKGFTEDAVLTGSSAIPSISVVLNYDAHLKGVPAFALEDYPGAYFYNLGKLFERVPEAKPDYLFVMNDWAKRINLSNSTSLPEKKIIITGDPAMDKISTLDKAKTRNDFRHKAGISESETMLAWFGQDNNEVTVESLRVFLKGLEILNPKNYRLAVRLHPRDNTSKEAYDALFAPFRDRLVDASRATEPDAQKVIAAADLVINERSTLAMQSAALGIPVISISIPEINQRYGVMIGLRVPVIEDGTSPLVDKPDGMAEVLEKVLFNPEFRHDLDDKMKTWIPDGKAGKRVADQIVALI